MVRLFVLNQSANETGKDGLDQVYYLEFSGKSYHGYYLEGGRLIENRDTFERTELKLKRDYHVATLKEIAEFQTIQK